MVCNVRYGISKLDTDAQPCSVSDALSRIARRAVFLTRSHVLQGVQCFRRALTHSQACSVSDAISRIPRRVSEYMYIYILVVACIMHMFIIITTIIITIPRPFIPLLCQ